MKQHVIYAGIDVDDERYHGSALDKSTGESLDFQCRATLKGLVQQLNKVKQYFAGLPLKLCYEASYVGFSLQRDLRERSFDCEVVAPSRCVSLTAAPCGATSRPSICCVSSSAPSSIEMRLSAVRASINPQGKADAAKMGTASSPAASTAAKKPPISCGKLA